MRSPLLIRCRNGVSLLDRRHLLRLSRLRFLDGSSRFPPRTGYRRETLPVACATGEVAPEVDDTRVQRPQLLRRRQVESVLS